MGIVQCVKTKADSPGLVILAYYLSLSLLDLHEGQVSCHKGLVSFPERCHLTNRGMEEKAESTIAYLPQLEPARRSRLSCLTAFNVLKSTHA